MTRSPIGKTTRRQWKALLRGMLNWFNLNSGAVQALAACAMLLVTVTLVVITLWYVRLTREALLVAQRQFRVQYQPLLSLSIDGPVEDPNEGDYVVLYVTNCGANSFRLDRLSVTFYCSLAAGSQTPPYEVPLASFRVFPPNDVGTYRVHFDRDDLQEYESHDGACDLIFCADVKASDIFGFERHQYSFDTALGLHYIADYTGLPFSLRRALARLWRTYQHKVSQMQHYDARDR